MKTILAIVLLSTSVGVTAYHATEDGEAQPDQPAVASINQDSNSMKDYAWNPPRFRAPIPLNIVSSAKIENSFDDEWYKEAVVEQSGVVEQPKAVEQFESVSVKPSLTPESEEPCVALKPFTPVPVTVAVMQRSKSARNTIEAIPVASESVAMAPSVNDAVPSSPVASSAMPMRRGCCPPRHASANASSFDRHLRPGPKWRN